MSALFPRDDTPACTVGNDYDGRLNVRIASVFVILVSSALGSFFPILSSRYSFIRLPDWCFFIAKFFGSGVIVATGFIHLLQPASEELGDPCLTGTFQEYPWAFAICLMSLFMMFFTEMIAHHFVAKAANGQEVSHSHFGNFGKHDDESDKLKEEDHEAECEVGPTAVDAAKISSVPGANHFVHDMEHQDPHVIDTFANQKEKEQYYNQILSLFILEFGVIFHSVFVGLSLATAGSEFNVLFVVIVFHQMFEGLGLGTRIAEAAWPRDKRATPWLMALAFTVVTPVAIAIGLGVRNSYNENSSNALIINGCFDSISAGILIYTGLVELMAHEFLYSNQFKGENGLRKMLTAFAIMCCGCGLMALLGKWA